MTFKTLYEIFKHSVENFSERIAFSMIDGEDVTYKEVGERAATVQELLLNAGVGAGDKVAILSSSMPNWGISYFAVVSAGMVVVPILPDFHTEQIHQITNHSEARLFIVADHIWKKINAECPHGKVF